jgi:outer membrane protein assembly factor BamB
MAFAQSDTPDSADPTGKAIEVYHSDNEHTGFDPISITTPLSVAWRLSGSASKANPASMVAADGTVYYGSGSNLVAVRITDGHQRWSVGIPSNGKVLTTPAISGNYLYVGSSTGSFYKINRADGSVVWTFKTQVGISSQPVVAGGLVYFGGEDTNCYALNAQTGKPVWQYATNSPVNAPPTVSGGTAYFASSDYSLYTFSSLSGRQGWSVSLSDDPSAGPVVAYGSSVLVAAGQWIYAFTAHSGSIRWKARMDDVIVSTPAVSTDGVFVATADNNVYGLSDRGEVRWKKTVGAPPASGLLLTQNNVIVGTKNGAIYSFDPVTGKLNWDYAIQPDSSASVTSVQLSGQPIYVDGTLLALTDDGALTAFRSDSPDAAPPKLSSAIPKPGTTVAGKGLTFSAKLIDYGSGIDPSSVEFALDGVAIPGGRYDADSNGLVDDDVKAKDLDLINGSHIVLVRAKDWRGNALSQSWGFTVDRTLNPKSADTDTSPDNTDPGVVQPPDTNPTPTPMNNGAGHQRPPAGSPPPPPVF